MQRSLPTAYDLRDLARSRFEGIPQSRPLFLNSIPKCGTLLLRNVLLMFVRGESVVLDEFIIDPNISQHQEFFKPTARHFLWGHVTHADEAARITCDARSLILVRDPFDYVLSYASFLYSLQNDATFGRYVRAHMLPVDRVIAAVIFGNGNSELYFEDLRDVYLKNAVAWLGTGTTLVRYEDLVWSLRHLDSPEAETYWRALIEACGFVEFPSDWRDRVRAGSDRKLSSTARENLDVLAPIPTELTATQKAMVEAAAPGIRAILGYGTDQAGLFPRLASERDRGD